MTFRMLAKAVWPLPLLLFSATAMAQPADQTNKVAKIKLDPKDPNFIICQKQLLSGPVVRYKKVCRTRQEWDAQDVRRQGDLEAVSNQRLINSCATLRCP